MQGRRGDRVPRPSPGAHGGTAPGLAQAQSHGSGRLPLRHRPRPSRYLESLQSHKTRLAILILDDEERAPIFIEGEGPDRRHGAAAVVSFPQPVATAPELSTRLPLAGGR